MATGLLAKARETCELDRLRKLSASRLEDLRVKDFIIEQMNSEMKWLRIQLGVLQLENSRLQKERDNGSVR